MQSMADVNTNLSLIQQEISERVAFQNGTLDVATLTDPQKQKLYDSLFPDEAIVNVNSHLSKVGSTVFGQGIAGINGGKFWIGIQSQVNPTLESHISHFIHLQL